MRLMLCGGTGFIGNALARELQQRGDEVWIVTRHLPAAPVAGLHYVTWEEWSQKPWQWNGIDAIVSLVGESVGKKWTPERKREILVSRTLTALRIEDIVRRMDQPPKVLINASGISIYGHSYSPLLKRKGRAASSRLSRKRSLFSGFKKPSRQEEEEQPLESSIASAPAPAPAKAPVTAESVGIRGFTPPDDLEGRESQPAPRLDLDERAAPIEREERTYRAENRFAIEDNEQREEEAAATGSRSDRNDSVDGTDEDLMELLAKLRSSSGTEEEFEPKDDEAPLSGNRHSSETMTLFDESSPANPEDYLGQVVVAWEEAVDRIPVERIVKLRISLVMGRDGGTFPLLRLPHKLFAGGRIGSGMQGFPWIHIDDMVGLILFCLDHPGISGAVNAVAPDPVNSDEFGRTLAHVAKRPYWFHAPASLVEKVLGEQSALLLTGQHAYPRKALEHGFVFSYPRLEDALRDLLHR